MFIDGENRGKVAKEPEGKKKPHFTLKLEIIKFIVVSGRILVKNSFGKITPRFGKKAIFRVAV